MYYVFVITAVRTESMRFNRRIMKAKLNTWANRRIMKAKLNTWASQIS